MPRNIRWDESVKENALNLVEALLKQADNEFDDLELKAAVDVEWLTENKLRVTGKEKQKRRNREQIVEVGTRKEHLVKLVEKAGKRLKLPKPKEESNNSQQERKLEEVQTALDCLKELGVREPKKAADTKGYWKFTLTLKHQTATREENLEVVKQKWKEQPKTNSLETSSTTSIQVTEKSIDWRDVCRAMLEKQKQLTTNRLMRADEMLFDISQICVDLALVERKQQDKRSEDDNPARSQSYKPDYEETQKLEYEDFLTKALKSEQSKKLAIIGEPGAGKTTLLQRIAFWILDNTDDLPIWIPLGNFPNPAPKFKDYLLNDWLEDAFPSVTPKIKDEFQELLMAGKVWLLLDGVDEMAAKSGSPLTVIANRIVGWCSCLRVVLTCRLNVWEANPYSLNGFQTYRTLEFSEEKVEEFIKACFQNRRGAIHCAPELGIQLQQALNQPGKERIKDLVRNPLRLTLLCSTWHLREGKLPDTKAELYQQFVEEVYRWQDKEKEVSTIMPEEREQLNAKLQELAVAAIDNETNRFCLRQKFVKHVFQDNSLFQLALEVGWLNQVGVDAKNPHQPVYAFFHPTFQEYFAALAIADWDFFLPRAHDNDNPKPVSERYRIFEPQWKEVILLWLGREEVEKEQKDEFIKALVEFQDGFCNSYMDYSCRAYSYRAYFLAADGIAEFSNCNFADEIVRQLVNWGLGYFNKQKWHRLYDNHSLEKEAIALLSMTHRTKLIAALCELIGNTQDEYTRKVAVYSLGEIASGNPNNLNAINVLVKLIDNSQDKFPRLLYAAESLEKIDSGNPYAIAALIKLFCNTYYDYYYQTPYEYIYCRAKQSLEEIDPGNPRAIAALVELIKDAQDKDIRWEAERILWRISSGNPIAIEALVELIKNAQDEDIRTKAAWSLEKISSSNPTAIEALVELIRNAKDESTRLLATWSLGAIDPDNPTASAALVELIRNAQDEHIRTKAAGLLGAIDPDNPTASAALVELIRNAQDEHIRTEAAWSLGAIGSGNPTAIMALVELTKNAQDKHIRTKAAWSLGEIGSGNSEAITALAELIGNAQDEDIRDRAAWSLEKIGSGNSEAIAALVELIKNAQDKFIRQQAVEILGKIGSGNPEAIAALVELIKNAQDESTQLLAAWNLEKIDPGNRVLIPALVELIGNAQDKFIRQQAVEILGKIGSGNSMAIGALIELIGKAQDESTQLLAAWGLEKIDPGNPEVIPALVELIGNAEDKSTCRQAAACLETILEEAKMADLEEAKMAEVVPAVRNYFLYTLAFTNDSERYFYCSKVIKYCTQNMTYPAFYQAWNSPSTTLGIPKKNQATLLWFFFLMGLILLLVFLGVVWVFIRRCYELS